MTDENNENRSDFNQEQTLGAEQTPPGTEQQAERIDPEQPVIETNSEAKKWASFCHLLGVAGFAAPLVGNIVGPLVMWLLKKDEFAFVDDQGKEAVNFQITITIYLAISTALIPACIGFVLFPLVAVFGLIMLIMATVNANNGIAYRYPLTIRFLK